MRFIVSIAVAVGLCVPVHAAPIIIPVPSVALRPVRIELMQLVLSHIDAPDQLQLILQAMESEQIAAVVMNLASSPGQMRLVIAAISPQVQVRLSLTDVDITRWMPILNWLAQSKHKLNWLDAGRDRISAAIQKHGFTDDLLIEAEILKIKASKK